jgi:alkylation response protein AidB-like acyl-CoA dehydrogenase
MELAVPEHVRPLRDRFAGFIDEHILPAEAILDRGRETDPECAAAFAELTKRAKEEGLWAVGHPTDIGGQGLPFLDYVYINEVIGRSDHAQWIFGTNSLQDSLMLRQHASEYWRSRYLEPLVAGDVIRCFAMTEPDVASSDPTRLQTTARLEGGSWILDGHKWFSSNAQRARYITVVARTEDEAVAPHDRFSIIVVPADAPGVRVVRVLRTMGSTAGNHCELTLTGVRVPEHSIIGERGAGFRIAQDRLGPGRIFHCMRWLGQAQRAYDLMCSRVVARSVSGGVLADKQLVQQMVFETAAEINSVRLLTLEAARLVDAGADARKEIGIVKVLGARALHNAVDRAIQTHGAAGLTDDLPLEGMYRRARYARIYDGPDEAHISNVARSLLKEYRS